jgi:hypothetical protein
MRFARRRKPEVPYCPQCLYKLEMADNISGWLGPKRYKCPKCDYRGSFYVTKEIEEASDKTEELNS